MLQSNEGHFLSATGMMCGNQIRLVEAVGSVDLTCEGARVTETFHPSSPPCCQLALLCSLSVWYENATSMEQRLLNLRSWYKCEIHVQRGWQSCYTCWPRVISSRPCRHSGYSVTNIFDAASSRIIFLLEMRTKHNGLSVWFPIRARYRWYLRAQPHYFRASLVGFLVGWLGGCPSARYCIRLSRITPMHAVVSAPPASKLTINTKAGPADGSRSHILQSWHVIAGVELQDG